MLTDTDDALTVIPTTNISHARLAERCAYNTTIYGNWDHFTTISETPNEYVVDRITRERSPREVREALERGQVMPAGSCRGGYHWHFDTDYPCSGCARCRSKDAPIGWSISAFLWNVACSAERTRLQRTIVAMEALAAIGQAVAAALAPGLGVSRWIRSAVTEWHQIRVGRYYEVIGRRGSAKAAYGKVGECRWIGETTYAGRATCRAGLKIEGSDKLVYVPASTLMPIIPPADLIAKRAVEKAIAEDLKLRASVRTPFPALYVSRGRRSKSYTPGIIIAGAHAGKRGRVFWMGEKKGGTRVGIDVGEAEPAWCDARDVVPAPAAHVTPHEHRAADGTLINPVEIAEQYVIALDAIGLEAEARAWATKMSAAAAEVTL